MSRQIAPTLCLDFDGVIHSYISGWYGPDIIPDPPVAGAFDAIVEYMKHFVVVICSSRFNHENSASGDCYRPRRAVADWFALNGWDAGKAPFSWYEDDPMKFGWLNLRATKPPALVTIDDRAITFDGTFPDSESLLNFKPWNKKGV